MICLFSSGIDIEDLIKYILSLTTEKKRFKNNCNKIKRHSLNGARIFYAKNRKSCGIKNIIIRSILLLLLTSSETNHMFFK